MIYFHYMIVEGFDCDGDTEVDYLEEVLAYMCDETSADTKNHYVVIAMLTYVYAFSFGYFWLSKHS
jgi:hypothetical protein